MKKILLLSASIMALTQAHAQTDKGSKMLGVDVGSVRYSATKLEKSINATLRPSAGWFVTNNLAVGAVIYADYSGEFWKGGESYSTLGLGLTPLVRYYVPGHSKHRLFAQATAGPVWNVFTRKSPPSLNPQSGKHSGDYLDWVSDAGIGYNYFLTP
jgi:hypothetical protein